MGKVKVRGPRSWFEQVVFDLVCGLALIGVGLILLGVVWLVRPATPDMPIFGRPHWTAPAQPVGTAGTIPPASTTTTRRGVPA